VCARYVRGLAVASLAGGTRQGAARTARARSLRGCGLRSGIGLSTRGSVAPYGLPAFACHLFTVERPAQRRVP